jgi:predicted aconitase with swiveling domain
MNKTFKGRPIIPGNIKGEALVTRQGFNILASYIEDGFSEEKKGICSDQNNNELYGKKMSGKVLCLPVTIGSTTGGVLLQIASEQKTAPSAMLFSQHIDSLAAAGVVLSKVWGNGKIITIDQLGSDFLNYIQDGMLVEINEDGNVIITE